MRRSSSPFLRPTPVLVREAVTNQMSPLLNLRVLAGANEGQVIEIFARNVRIGRDSTSELCFPHDTKLARLHAELFFMGSVWILRDFGSTNGSTVGGRFVRGGAAALPFGTVFWCGGQCFRVEDPQDDPDPPAIPTRTALAPTTPVSQPTLERPWRWVPPDQPISVGNFVLPGGMVYVGRGLKTASGHGTEPALLDPSLKVALPANADRPTRGTGDRTGYSLTQLFRSFYTVSYHEATPTGRMVYLRWLAGERRDPHVLPELVLLFLFGLERRLTGVDGAVPLTEQAQIVAEITRLRDLYAGGEVDGRVGRVCTQLLQWRATVRLISGDVSLPTGAQLQVLPRQYAEIPFALALALARMARDKTPLDADYALAWVLHDPETVTTHRAAAVRCSGELRELFRHRFNDTYPKGVRLTTTRRPLRYAYTPASPTYYGQIQVETTEQGLLHVGTAPLRKIREVTEGCLLELDTYSRYIGRRPEQRGSFLAASLLPDPLFADAERVRRVQEFLASVVTDGSPFVLPTSTLIAQFLASPGQADTPQILTQARAESTLAAQALERLGYRLEPDARYGTLTLAQVEQVALMGGAGPAASLAPETVKGFRPLFHLLASVWGEAGGAAQAGEALTLAREIAALVALDPDREALFTAWLLQSPDHIKAARQAPALVTALAGDVREHIGDIFIEAAFRAATTPPGPATVKRLTTAWRILGLPETDLYEALHHRSDAPRRSRAASGLHTLAPAAPASPGYALPAPPPEPTDRPTRTPRRDAARKRRRVGEAAPAALLPAPPPALALDVEAIRRKANESAHIGRLLGDIFADETAVAPPANASVSPQVNQAGTPYHALLSILLAHAILPASQFAALATQHGLFPGAAREHINERAWAIADDPALEGDDPIVIDRSIIEELLAAGAD